MSGQNNDLIIRSATKGASYFTQICNEFLRDPDIPFDEKGFLAYLLTFSSNWRVTFAHILATNHTIKLKGLRSLIRRLQKRGYIGIIPQKRNEKGVFKNPVIIASDDREKVKRALELRIAGTAQAIAEALDGSPLPPPTPEGNPVEDEPPTPQRQAARRQAATEPLRISTQIKNNEKKEKISLSPDASASAQSQPEREILEGFDRLLEAAKWHTSSFKPANRKAAAALYADHPPQTREQLTKAAGLQDKAFERQNRANNRDESHRGFNISLHEWLKGPYIPFLADARKLLELEAAAKAAEISRQQMLEAEYVTMQEQVLEACSAHPDNIIRWLCEYLNPERSVAVTAQGFTRGSWSNLKGPTPDHHGCLYPPYIMQEAQRRNNEVSLRETGPGAIEHLAKVRAGRAKWDAVRYGPPPGHPGCLIDPAILEQVEALSARAA